MKESRSERSKREIMEAAKAIVHRRGHEAVTVRNVADMTGFAHTSLYYYFKDMDSLFWSLRLDMIEEMIVELQAMSMTRPDPIDEVTAAFTCYANYFFDHPNVFRFFYFHPFIQPEGDDRYQALEQRLQGTWQSTFSRLMKEGIVEVKDLEIVAKTIIYALQGMIMLSFSFNSTRQREDTERELSQMIRYLLDKQLLSHEEDTQ